MAVHVLAVLASSVNTNPVIVRRLLLTLQGARLVETLKGPGSGSRLSRSAERINLAEVYRAVELEEPFGLPRKRPNRACPIGQGIRVALDQVCRKAAQAVQRDLEETTLASLVQGIMALRELENSPADTRVGSNSHRKR